MRRWMKIVTLWLACWCAGDAAMAAVGPYSPCCVAACADWSACLHSGCTTCVALGAAVLAAPLLPLAASSEACPGHVAVEWPSGDVAVWVPPG